MPKIPVNDAKPGMRLSRAVVNDSGMVLLGGDTLLTDALIARLHNMNVSAIDIVGTAIPEKSMEQMLSELDERFRKTGDKRHMFHLKKAFAKHIEGMYKVED